MLFSEMQLLVSGKLKREAFARHNGKKILQERFYQESEVIVLWRQSSGALPSIMMLDVSVESTKVGICMRCARNGMLFKHAFL